MKITIIRFIQTWTRRERIKVLLAEDGPEGEDYEKQLARYNITRVTNGMDLVVRAEEFFYPIIISDTEMPIMDGDQACRMLLDRNKHYRECPENKGCIIGISSKIDHLDEWAGIAHETRYKEGIDDLGRTVSFIYKGFCGGERRRFKEHTLK